MPTTDRSLVGIGFKGRNHSLLQVSNAHPTSGIQVGETPKLQGEFLPFSASLWFRGGQD